MPTATPFNNLITFSRGSNATVTGSNGLIQWAASNNATFSEQFDNAAWAKNSSSIAANVTTAPDGTRTADTWTPTSNGNTGAVRLLGTFTIPVGPNATTSIYVKSAGKRWVYLTTPAALSPLHNCWFDLQTGVVGTMGSGVLAATMTAVGDGWYRISTTSATTLATNYVFLSATDADNSTTVVADGTGVHVWGAQLELGSTATTYNPTTVKNLLGFSEAFDNAAWTKTNSSIVTGAQANPINGLFNAQKLMEDTVAAVPHGFASANVTTIVGTPMTSAFYAKAAGRSWVVANAFNAANKRCWFDLANGTAGTTAAGCTTSITSVGNGWYRCAVIQTAAATTMSLGLYASTADGVLSYTGDGNSGVYIYGAQLSDSASLDPYVPTPGAAPSSTAFYGPRFDYDPVTLQPRGLLVEEQRTNLATYSNTFSDASWTAFGTKNLVANSTVSPDGEVNASTLTDNSAAAFQGMGKTATVANDNATYTASIYVCKTTGGTSATFGVNLQLTGGTLVTAQPRLNTDTGALINGTGTVQNAGAYWRLTTTVTNNTTGNTTLALAVYPATAAYNSGTDSAAATGSAIIYGAQLEAGAFATSYIPTVASTVTRSADVATITGQNFAQWYGQPEGSFVFEGSSFGIGSNLPTFLNASDGTTNNYLRMNGASGYTGRSFVQSGGATSANITVGAGLASGVNTKTAAVYAANSFQLSVNATLGTEDTSGAVPVTPNQIAFGNWFGSAGTILNGHIRNIRFIPARAADFQLQGLST